MSVNSVSPMLSQLAEGFNAKHANFAAEIRALVETVNAAKGVKQDPLKFFADTNDEELRAQVEKFHKAIEIADSIKAALTKAMEAELSNSGTDSETAKNELRERQNEVKAFNSERRAFIKGLEPIYSSPEEKEAFEALLVSSGSVRSGGGSSATGVKRPRFARITVDGTSLDTPTLTELKKETGVKKSEIDAALYAAAGVDDISEFTGDRIVFTLTDNSGKRYDIAAFPKTADNSPAADDNADDDVEPSDEDIADIDEDVYDDDDE